MNEEVAKYIKKRKSDVSNSWRKSKHKHSYEPCLFKEYVDFFGVVYNGGSYCTECGKIGGHMLGGDAVRLDNGFYRALSNEELIDKYKNYPTFEVESQLQGYVPVSK